MEIEVYFWFAGKNHGFRKTAHIPQVNDAVLLKTGLYQVKFRVWDFSNEEMNPRKVRLELRKIGDE